MVGEHCATQKELVAIFKTIGYQYRPKHGDFYQKSCMMDTDECTLTKDNINFIKDINGDGRPEVLITDSGTEKYGMTGVGFSLLTKDKTGYRLLIDDMIGHYEPLSTTGKNGYPDIMVGGRGLCHGVWRYNGVRYDLHRHSTFEGQDCTPNTN